MPNTFRGKAQLTGSPVTVDVILYPIAQSVKLSHKWKENMVMDTIGDDYGVRAHNEMYDYDLGLIFVDQSASSTLANAKAGAAFLAPLTTMTISADDQSWVNGAWQYSPDSDIDRQNTETTKGAYKLRRWANSTQNTLMTSTPG